MKIKIFLPGLFSLLFLMNLKAQLIADWQFDGETLAVTNTNGVTGSDAVRGSGLTSPDFYNCSGDAIANKHWTETSENNAISADDSYSFTIAVTAQPVTVTQVTFIDKASGTGPKDWALYIDSTSYGSGTAHSSCTGNTINIPGGITLALGIPVKFVLYAWGGESTVGTFRVDNFTINGSVLPVQLTSFTAEATAGGVQLYWQTASEENNDYFEVQYATDGIDFETLDRVAGAGTILEPQQYSFLHRQPGDGEHYYRLKQVDYDGAFEYSPVQMVRMRKVHNNFQIRPVLATHTITFQTGLQTKSRSMLEVYSLHGKRMQRIQLAPGIQTQVLDISNLPRGLYFARFNYGRNTEIQRFQKL